MRLLILHAHPLPDSFSSTLFRTAGEALSAAGHEVRPLDLYAQGFAPAMSLSERARYHNVSRNQLGIEDQIAHLRWAEGIIFVYPTWWLGMPAMLKGWIDRCLVPGVAFTMPAGNGPIRPALTGVRLLGGISTYGSSWWLIRWSGDLGKRLVMRGIRPLCAPGCRSFWLAKYRMDSATLASRRLFIGRVRHRLGTIRP